MQIKIKVPMMVSNAWHDLVEWGDILVFEHKKFIIRRIDFVIAFALGFCTSFYAYHDGWTGALTGAAMFIFVGLTAKWFFQSEE